MTCRSGQSRCVEGSNPSSVQVLARSGIDSERKMARVSKRPAAALLRLALQHLIVQIGGADNDLNAAVGDLVANGLPIRVEQAMDTVRLIGNEAVHPGTLDVNDDPAMALTLFELVNLVVETMVTQPRLIDEMFNRLPSSKLEAIDKRDGR